VTVVRGSCRSSSYFRLPFFAQRASAALRAISRRFSGGTPSQRALPPLGPPVFPPRCQARIRRFSAASASAAGSVVRLRRFGTPAIVARREPSYRVLNASTCSCIIESEPTEKGHMMQGPTHEAPTTGAYTWLLEKLGSRRSKRGPVIGPRGLLTLAALAERGVPGVR
jgi:hypothetical protein